MEGREGDAPARPRNSITSWVFSSCSACTVPKPRKRRMYDSSHQRPCCAPLPLHSSRKPYIIHTCTHLQHEYFSPTIGTGYTGSSHLVGVRMMAPIWLRLSSTSLLRIISMAGTTKARVFPDPVTASTHTSLFVRKSGIVAA